jgi:ribosomal protein S8
MRHDLLNDALVTLRHADQQGQATVTLAPSSRLIGEVLRLLQEHQYVKEFSFVQNGRGASTSAVSSSLDCRSAAATSKATRRGSCPPRTSACSCSARTAA